MPIFNTRSCGWSALTRAQRVQEVLKEYGDVVLAYGESDEYSFVFRKGTTLYGMPCDIHTMGG